MPGNRTAEGGSIHPIEELPLTDGENSPELMLSPGREWEWESGFWCAALGCFLRRDSEEIPKPRRFSPFPGQTIILKNV